MNLVWVMSLLLASQLCTCAVWWRYCRKLQRALSAAQRDADTWYLETAIATWQRVNPDQKLPPIHEIRDWYREFRVKAYVGGLFKRPVL